MRQSAMVTPQQIMALHALSRQNRSMTVKQLELFREIDDAFSAHVAEHGFAVLADALDPSEVAAVNAETLRLCRGDLTTIARGQGAADDSMSDDDALRRYSAIHNPDKLSEYLNGMVAHPRVVKALTSVIGPDVKSMQSMMFIKASGKPGQAWHQDEYFIPTRDRSLHAAWIALDDATTDNGCLWVLPGSHRRGVLYPADQQDNLDEFGCTIEARDFPYSDDDAIPVEIPAGAALIFNGYLLHRSLRNSGQHGYRRAFVNHYMSCSSLLPWQLPDGVKVGDGDYRDIVVVAGTDPYAYKGIETRRRAHIRRDGDTGCDS